MPASEERGGWEEGKGVKKRVLRKGELKREKHAASQNA